MRPSARIYQLFASFRQIKGGNKSSDMIKAITTYLDEQWEKNESEMKKAAHGFLDEPAPQSDTIETRIPKNQLTGLGSDYNRGRFDGFNDAVREMKNPPTKKLKTAESRQSNT